MKLEESLKYLREGKRIFRKSRPDDGLKWNVDGNCIQEGFYITVFDILADDWKIKE